MTSPPHQHPRNAGRVVTVSPMRNEGLPHAAAPRVFNYGHSLASAFDYVGKLDATRKALAGIR